MSTVKINYRLFLRNAFGWMLFLLFGINNAGYSQSLGLPADTHLTQIQEEMADDNALHTLSFQEYVVYDLKIPMFAKGNSIYLELKGGDGGKRWYDDGMLIHWTRNGGGGAIVNAKYKIGDGPNEIPESSTLRFIVGSHGENWRTGAQYGAGGGNATAVFFYHPFEYKWTLLAVAGAGGGAYGDALTDSPGKSAETGENGSSGKKANIDGSGSNGGDAGSLNLGAGGTGIYAMWDGATGTTDQSVNPIPFGKGAAVGGRRAGAGGGGGGFSGGGGGGMYGGGGGGGSFVNLSKTLSSFDKIATGTTGNPQNGYIKYKLDQSAFETSISPGPLSMVHSSTDKCIHTKDGWMGEGAWLELWDCTGTTAQQWVIDGFQIKALNNTDRCVTIENASVENGSQIILWGCHGDEHQQWVYDGVKGLFRSKKNFKKCLSLGKPSIANGTKIQLMDCAVKADQQWLFDGTRTSPTSDRIHTISPAYATDKCFHTKEGSTDNGANVELWDCLGTAAQKWYFSSTYIKFNSDHDKCLTLPVGEYANGTNIYLEDCNGGYRQQWVYDGFNRSIRSVRSPDKCIHIKAGSLDNGANVELWNCLGTPGQQFEIR